MTRRDRIVALVWSLEDALPGVRSHLHDREPGSRRESPSRWDMCEPCGGTGERRDRFGHVSTCSVCSGRGRVRVDGYTGRQVSTSDVHVDAPVERVGCSWCQEPERSRWDSARRTWVPVERRYDTLPRGSGVRGTVACRSCDGTGWRRLTPAPAETRASRTVDDGVLLQTWARRGSYRELLVELGELRARDRDAYLALLHRVRQDTDPLCDWAAARGLAFLHARLPERLLVPGAVIAAWLARGERARQLRGPLRDRRIREALRAGEPVSSVARRAGISERHVRRIRKAG